MEKYYLAALSFVDGCSHGRTRILVNYFKGAENIWRATEQELLKSKFLTQDSIDALLALKKQGIVDKLAQTCTDKQINLVTYLDADYPANLREIIGFPVCLYYKGKSLNEIKNPLGIVGPRKSTSYAKDVVRFFVEKFAGYEMTIISGGARGIDTVSHQAALKHGLHTVAVLGCGLDITYPAENGKIFSTIAEQGTLLSEYPPGSQPLAWHFPARNRIISGLSSGVLLAEAGQRSGSLITAEFALDQGREVYCVPGDIFSANSFGVHNLIKQGAKLASVPADILEDYFPDINFDSSVPVGKPLPQTVCQTELIKPEPKENDLASLSVEQLEVLQILKYDLPMSMDEIHMQCSLDIGSLNLVLLELEILGYLHMDVSQRKYLKIRGVD